MMIYRMQELRAVAGRLNGARTTKLVNIRTGGTMFEVIGKATKGEIHIAYLKEMCKVENLDVSVR